MIRAAKVARSRAVMRWLGSGQPVALAKLLPVRPISWPLRVISAAKASSVPLRPSASTMQASLPDCTITPRSRSSTRTILPTSTNIFEPPLRHAFSLTGSSSSNEMRPSLSRSNTM